MSMASACSTGPSCRARPAAPKAALGPNCRNLHGAALVHPRNSKFRSELMAQAAPLVPTATDFALPPVMTNEPGQVRTVGVEIEFAGPTAERSRGRCGALGGRLIVEEDPMPTRSRTRHSATSASNSTAGSCTRARKRGILGGMVPKIAAWFGSAARYLVPCELVTAPIPMDRLHEVTSSSGSCAAWAPGARRTRLSMPSACISIPRFPARTQRPRPPSSRASSCSTRGCASRWRPTRRATFWASPIPSRRPISACSRRRITGPTSRPSSTTTSRPTRPGTAISISCRCCSISTRTACARCCRTRRSTADRPSITGCPTRG